MLDKNDIEKLIEVFPIKSEVATKKDLQEVKDDILEFKSEILTGQDEILSKLDILLTEKPMEDAQDKRRANVLKIHDNALRRAKILSEGEVMEINKLGTIN
ncbi:hypothetical protein A3G50_02005 [Candidatus Jorgensenbacteria bacterium RIFCSPLOWO2_12_FULL_42_11]|uniref:Uncharacterized protein n=1 Tax=Candidatus Jorgensenbacteria bacterium RIFCSPLOWO2_12_FULL_42_11 TaxID=1798473 RepID=A0A1F6C3A5_9BACT|nr:MAG: hypothetical protein A3G50_02005 [Candidatus Jorgensenbacteria bacterium RIFCSPLOWO2_12_FULL_42_11]